MANVSWTIRPSQNVGIATAAAATAEIERSTAERWVTAATIPAGTAAATANTNDATSNSIDAGSRSMMRSSTGRPSLKLNPQSPRTNAASQLTYCSPNDRSRPKARRRRSRSSGLTPGFDR